MLLPTRTTTNTKMYITFLFITITTLSATIAKTAQNTACTSWDSLQDCAALTPCFWVSTTGTCHNVHLWTKSGVVDRLGPCARMMNLNECYTRMQCFWVAKQGVCEDIANWAPVGSQTVRTTIDPLTMACSFWQVDKECWMIDKCFWNKRTELCEEIVMPPPKPQPPLVPANGGGAMPVLPPLDPANPVLPVVPGGGIVVTFSPTQSHTPPPRLKPHSWSPNLPASFSAPMNLCETLYTSDSCLKEEDCQWSSRANMCYLPEGVCSHFPTKASCRANENCRWHRHTRSCLSFCDLITKKVGCKANEDSCLWDERASECVPVEAECNRFPTEEYCEFNENCFWVSQTMSCVSYFGTCEVFPTEAECEVASRLNKRCIWDEDPVYENQYRCLDPFSENGEFIVCEAIRERDVCEASNSTESGMPCFWSEGEGRCDQYEFDCEAFSTEALCNAAGFKNVQCYWAGECEEVELTSTNPSVSTTLSETPNGFYYPMVFFGSGLLLGVLGGLMVTYRRIADLIRESFDLPPSTFRRVLID